MKRLDTTTPCRGKVLFIMHKDLDAEADSGSSVRPKKMIEAFRSIGYDLLILEGLQNRVFERHQSVTKLRSLLKAKHTEFAFCYIEPPAGPLFCPTDLSLLKDLRKLNIPTGLFYRDAYYLYPEYYGNDGRLKEALLQYMSKRDFKVFSNTCDVIFTPSDSFSKLVNFPNRMIALPPACSVGSIEANTPQGKEVTAIFVGSADKWYGAFLTLDAFKAVNESGVTAPLIFICPEGQWSNIDESYRALESEPWLEVMHLSGDQLNDQYKKADYAILPYLQTPYNDIAMPVKLFEYISFQKPIITTNCTDKANFIKRWNIGVVAEDNVPDFAQAIKQMIYDEQKFGEFKRNLPQALVENTWEARAETVTAELEKRQNV